MKMRLFLYFGSAVALGLSTGCFDQQSATPAIRKACPACCSRLESSRPAREVPGDSIYQLESMWTTDTGQSIRLEKLGGRVQVIAMFFANCQAACPLLVHDMKRIEEGLPPEIRDRVGFTLVTIDPERDTPAALNSYRQRVELDAQRWILLRGQPEDIQELAMLLGVKYKRETSGQFAHSNLITVLDPEGKIIHQQIGLGQSPEQALAVIQRIASDRR